jgi:effector-binding domain-containing protein
VDHISRIQSVTDSKKSQVIQLKRNGDGQLTKICIYKELFSYFNRIRRKSAFASIYTLYDVHTGIFWWRYFENDEYDDYFKREIDVDLSNVGYWEDEDTVYNYYDKIRETYNYLYFSAYKIVEFYVGTELSYRGYQGRYETFEQAYEALISNITENRTFLEPWEGEVPLWKYLDRHFFNIPYRTLSPTITKLISVQYSGQKWTVKIEGSDWREETPEKKARVTVVLNENYEMVDILGEDYLKKKSTD